MAGRNISQSGLNLIKTFEGYRDQAYRDSAGIWTIGYGTIRINGLPVTQGMTCTPFQADEWLREKLVAFETDINRLVHVPLGQNQFDALCAFVYNVGTTNFLNSSLLRDLNLNATTPIIAARFTDWDKISVHVNGQIVHQLVPGLLRRREAEYQLFVTPDAPIGRPGALLT